MSDIKITVRDAKDIPAKLAQIFDLVSRGIRGGAVLVTLGRPTRSLDQNAKFHAMISDISASVVFDGKQYKSDTWKIKLVDDFEHELLIIGEQLSHPGEMILSLDGRRIISKPASTSKMQKQEGSKFIEYLYMKGAECGAKFKEKAVTYYEEAMAYLSSKKR